MDELSNLILHIDNCMSKKKMEKFKVNINCNIFIKKLMKFLKS